jgi:hypothetical protein
MGGEIIFHSENVVGGTRSRLQNWVFLVITYIDCGRQTLETQNGSRWPRSVGSCPCGWGPFGVSVGRCCDRMVMLGGGMYFVHLLSSLKVKNTLCVR